MRPTNVVTPDRWHGAIKFLIGFEAGVSESETQRVLVSIGWREEAGGTS